MVVHRVQGTIFGGKKSAIEIDSSIWREEIGNRNRLEYEYDIVRYNIIVFSILYSPQSSILRITMAAAAPEAEASDDPTTTGTRAT